MKKFSFFLGHPINLNMDIQYQKPPVLKKMS